jgi:glyoxylase-like metal-dependent hydrolase (beta-lactamase superfamily II)
VKPDLASVKAFFGFQNWPEEVRTFDLGGRPIDVVGIPGHTDDSIAMYDRRTGILLTGDTVYPGRLYVADFEAFKTSIHRLAAFTADKPIAQVLGNHIEQTSTPFVDYPVRTKYQPEEHELALSAGSILELDRALQAMKEPKTVFLRDMTISVRGH